MRGQAAADDGASGGEEFDGTANRYDIDALLAPAAPRDGGAVSKIAKEKAEHIKAEESHGGIHMPDQSWYPLFAAFGLFIGAYNFAQLHHPLVMFGNQVFASHLPLAITGGVIMVSALYLWALEGPGGYHIHIGADGKVTESRGDHH